MTVKQNVTKGNRANKGEVKWTYWCTDVLMYWCDFCLFKVGFNQLINKLSFMCN